MAKLLKLSGHAVRVAHSGPDAIASAREHAPEVVVLDIGLPGMDGYEVAGIAAGGVLQGGRSSSPSRATGRSRPAPARRGGIRPSPGQAGELRYPSCRDRKLQIRRLIFDCCAFRKMSDGQLVGLSDLRLPGELVSHSASRPAQHPGELRLPAGIEGVTEGAEVGGCHAALPASRPRIAAMLSSTSSLPSRNTGRRQQSAASIASWRSTRQ